MLRECDEERCACPTAESAFCSALDGFSHALTNARWVPGTARRRRTRGSARACRPHAGTPRGIARTRILAPVPREVLYWYYSRGDCKSRHLWHAHQRVHQLHLCVGARRRANATRRRKINTWQRMRGARRDTSRAARPGTAVRHGDASTRARECARQRMPRMRRITSICFWLGLARLPMRFGFVSRSFVRTGAGLSSGPGPGFRACGTTLPVSTPRRIARSMIVAGCTPQRACLCAAMRACEHPGGLLSASACERV